MSNCASARARAAAGAAGSASTASTACGAGVGIARARTGGRRRRRRSPAVRRRPAPPPGARRRAPRRARGRTARRRSSAAAGARGRAPGAGRPPGRGSAPGRAGRPPPRGAGGRRGTRRRRRASPRRPARAGDPARGRRSPARGRRASRPRARRAPGRAAGRPAAGAGVQASRSTPGCSTAAPGAVAAAIASESRDDARRRGASRRAAPGPARPSGGRSQWTASSGARRARGTSAQARIARAPQATSAAGRWSEPRDVDGQPASPAAAPRRRRVPSAAAACVLRQHAHREPGRARRGGERAVRAGDAGGRPSRAAQSSRIALGPAEHAGVGEEHGWRGRACRGSIAPHARSEQQPGPRPACRTARGGVVNALFLSGAEGLVLLQGLLATALLGPSAIGLYGVVTTTAMTVVQLRRVGIDEAFVAADGRGRGGRVPARVHRRAGDRAARLAADRDRRADPRRALRRRPAARAHARRRLPAGRLRAAGAAVGFFRRMDFLRLRLLQVIVPLGTVLVDRPAAARRGRRVGAGDRPVLRQRGGGDRGLEGVAVSGCGCASTREAARRYLRFSWPVFVDLAGRADRRPGRRWRCSGSATGSSRPAGSRWRRR